VEQSDHEVLDQALKDFRRSVEITRDVRFQANLRLSRRQRSSAYIVSILSLYVIALSLIPNIVTLNQFQSQLLLACSVVLSVFVIFTSLIDGSQNFFHQGELLHQCARKIATVHHRLKTIDIASDPEAAKNQLVELEKKYQEALDECPINHDNVDFYREISRKPHLFPQQYSFKCRVIIKFWYWLIAWIMEKIWMIFHIIALAIISYIVYRYIFHGAQPI
jgi:hypothetical protein